MNLRKLSAPIIGVVFAALTGCASQNPNDDRAKDFTAKQLGQVSQLLDDFAKSHSCGGYELLSRQEGEYPSDTTRRLQFWLVNICGAKTQMIVMTQKVSTNGLEVCISDRGPCAIVDSGLIKTN